MKKFFALLLACLMLLSLAACKKNNTTPSDATGSTGPVLPTFSESANPVVDFSLSLDLGDGTPRSLSAISHEDGTVCVTFSGAETKSIDYNSSVYHGITAKLEQSGLSAMHGQDQIQEGNQSGSMNITFADGTIWSVAFQGVVPEAFQQGFAEMEAFILQVIATEPVDAAE